MSNVAENKETEAVNQQNCIQDSNLRLELFNQSAEDATAVNKKDCAVNFSFSDDGTDNSATLSQDPSSSCAENKNSENSKANSLSDAMIAALLSENKNSEKNSVKAENSLDSIGSTALKTNETVDLLENQKIDKPVENDIKECEIIVSSVSPCEISIAKTTSYGTSSYRCEELSSSWTEDESSSSSESDSSDCSDTFLDEIRENQIPKKIPNIKTKGELDLDDLPLIEDLYISVKESELEKIGAIYAIVDKLVIVQTVKDSKALDLESVLFLSSEKPLGRIFDVFGPVVQPFYSIRFNSIEHITEKGISIGADVYFAPDVNDITSYIFVDELKKQKGSDASWKDNNEPPEEFLDFSDDEQERAARRRRQAKNRNRINNESIMVTCAQVPVSTKAALSTSFTNDHPVHISSRGINHDASQLTGSSLSFSQHSTPSVSHATPPPSRYSPMSLSRTPNPFQIASSSPQQPMIFLQPQQHILPMQQRNISSPLVGPQSPFPNYQPPVFGQIPIMAVGSSGLLPPPYPPPVVSPAPPLSQITTMLPPPQLNFIRPSLFNPTNVANASVNTPPSFVTSSIANHANFVRPAATPRGNFMQPSVPMPVTFSRPPVTSTRNVNPSIPNYIRSHVPRPSLLRHPVYSPTNFTRPPIVNPRNFASQFSPVQTNNSVFSHEQSSPNISNIGAPNQNFPPNFF